MKANIWVVNRPKGSKSVNNVAVFLPFMGCELSPASNLQGERRGLVIPIAMSYWGEL